MSWLIVGQLDVPPVASCPPTFELLPPVAVVTELEPPASTTGAGPASAMTGTGFGPGPDPQFEAGRNARKRPAITRGNFLMV